MGSPMLGSGPRGGWCPPALSGLAADVVDGIRATGRGYNARVEKVLREAIAKGRL